MKQRYGNHSRASGVTHFELHADGLTVHFRGRTYRYTTRLNGPATIQRMKMMATAGRGLGQFIAAHRPHHEGA